MAPPDGEQHSSLSSFGCLPVSSKVCDAVCATLEVNLMANARDRPILSAPSESALMK